MGLIYPVVTLTTDEIRLIQQAKHRDDIYWAWVRDQIKEFNQGVQAQRKAAQ